MKKFKLLSHRKIVIIINLFLIITLMSVSVYAWFVSRVDNRADAYDITVESGDALELSFDQSTWSGTLNLSEFKINNTSVLDSMKFVNVTSNGEYFYIPELIQHDGYATTNTNVGAMTPAVANQDYLNFTIYMRSKEALNVYFSSDSKATPASSIVSGVGCGNPSTYASGENTFSKDCVVGALRVCFNNSAGARKIWITNPELHLNNIVGSDEYTMDFNSTAAKYSDGTFNGSVGSTFYWNDSYVHYFVDTHECYTYGRSNTITALPNTITEVPSDETLLCTLTKANANDEYFTGSATFKVWIEGCDTEARRALVGGKFNLSLVFDSFGV